MKRYIQSAASNITADTIYWYKRYLKSSPEASRREVISYLSGPNSPLVYVFTDYESQGSDDDYKKVLYAATIEPLSSEVLRTLELSASDGPDDRLWYLDEDLDHFQLAIQSYNHGQPWYSKKPNFTDSYEDEIADEPESDEFTQEAVEFAIEIALSVPKSIATIIYKWYEGEDAFYDFDSLDEFVEYLETDIYEMLDACDDPELADRIRNAIR